MDGTDIRGDVRQMLLGPSIREDIRMIHSRLIYSWYTFSVAFHS